MAGRGTHLEETLERIDRSAWIKFSRFRRIRRNYRPSGIPRREEDQGLRGKRVLLGRRSKVWGKKDLEKL